MKSCRNVCGCRSTFSIHVRIEGLLNTLPYFYVGLVVLYSVFRFAPKARYGILFLTLTIIVSLVSNLKRQDSSQKRAFLLGRGQVVGPIFLSGIAAFVGAYFYLNFYQLLFERVSANSSIDYIFAAVALFLVLLVTAREMGYVIPLLSIMALLYMLRGEWFPSYLYHSNLSLTRILQTTVLEMEGIFGFLNQLGGTWIAIFIVLAALIYAYGGQQIVTELGRFIAARYPALVTQTAVVMSMIFGSFSGSAAANVAGTGPFTIPLMKRHGVPSAYAAAIEAVASSGGQIMPPIMGAVAFLMCDFLSENYINIVARAIVPGLLFYITVALAVFFSTRGYTREVEKRNHEHDDLSSKTRRLLVPFSAIIASIIVLFLMLGYLRWGISKSAFFAIVTLLGVNFIACLAKKKVRDFLFKLSTAVNSASKMSAAIGISLACVGIVVRGLTVTGLSQKLSFFMVDMAHGNLWLLLGLIGIVSIIFGMAVATSAAYVLVVILAAPALTTLGVNLYVAHFLVFYLAMLSAITPPVAAAVLVASGIANSGYLKTCAIAMRLGMPLFVLPFCFVTYPALIEGNTTAVCAGIIVGVGLAAIAYALNSPTRGLFQYVKRGLFLAMGALILLNNDKLTQFAIVFVTFFVLLSFFKTAIVRRRT
ncbi:hypothetical protein DRN75_01600 [Nanoarchaeota archaeon]|nr:MAG: hypothetical protein DRN75_01600 [Nanoarchaeota archaeon]